MFDRAIAGNSASVPSQGTTRLNDIRLIFNVQESAEINNALIKSINSGSLTIPYEYLQTHTATREITDAAVRVSFNKTLYSSVGDILRKIYLTWEIVNHSYINFHYNEFMDLVKFYLNSTLLGEYYADSFDDVKGNINHIVNGYTHHNHEGNFFLPLYFCDPESHDITISGLKMQPSTIYAFEIDKAPTNTITGTLNYNVHLVSVKYLVITSRGLVVMNSLVELDLNKSKNDIPLM